MRFNAYGDAVFPGERGYSYADGPRRNEQMEAEQRTADRDREERACSWCVDNYGIDED